jgi:glycosyltransferase involved in cell wall biosynthesis
MEQSLGHITHCDNLAKLLPDEASIDADLFEVPWDTEGWTARVPVYRSNWTVRAGLRARRGIRRLAEHRRLDALFIHTQVPAVLSPDWLARVPTIVSVDATPLQYDELGEQYAHERGGARVEALKFRANRACFHRAAHLVSWSAWAKQGLVEGYGVDAANVTVVAPGVTPSLWNRPAPRTAHDGPVRILFVGGDLGRKGGDVLLDAFRDLRAGGADAELHLVTPSPVLPAPGVIVHHDLGPNSPRLIELYHHADVFCLPTRGDCLPMVLSEAGAAGLPLVSTAIAGIPEIARDGETGLLVPVGDRPALTRALRTLVDDTDLRLRLGAAAAELVGRDYDAKQNVGRLVELLVAVADRGSPS